MAGTQSRCPPPPPSPHPPLPACNPPTFPLPHPALDNTHRRWGALCKTPSRPSTAHPRPPNHAGASSLCIQTRGGGVGAACMRNGGLSGRRGQRSLATGSSTASSGGGDRPAVAGRGGRGTCEGGEGGGGAVARAAVVSPPHCLGGTQLRMAAGSRACTRGQAPQEPRMEEGGGGKQNETGRASGTFPLALPLRAPAPGCVMQTRPAGPAR